MNDQQIEDLTKNEEDFLFEDIIEQAKVGVSNLAHNLAIEFDVEEVITLEAIVIAAEALHNERSK